MIKYLPCTLYLKPYTHNIVWAEEDFDHICNECNSISKMLKGLIKIRKG